MSTVSSPGRANSRRRFPTRSTRSTDQYNASLNYTGEKGFFQAAYYGSIFKNNVSSITWQDVNDPTKSRDHEQRARQRVPPDPAHRRLQVLADHQARDERVLRRAARRTSSFVTGAQNNQLPLGAADQLAQRAGRHQDLQREAHVAADEGPRLSPRPTSSTIATTSTPVNTYIFQDAQRGAAAAHVAVQRALGLPGDIAGQQHQHLRQPALQQEAEPVRTSTPTTGSRRASRLKVGYEYQKIDRKCDGSWINCADANSARRTRCAIEWKATLVENVIAPR